MDLCVCAAPKCGYLSDGHGPVAGTGTTAAAIPIKSPDADIY